jgi:hypothetical protein
MINDYYPGLSTVDLSYVIQKDLEGASFQKVQLTARTFEFHFLKCHQNKAFFIVKRFIMVARQMAGI